VCAHRKKFLSVPHVLLMLWERILKQMKCKSDFSTLILHADGVFIIWHPSVVYWQWEASCVCCYWKCRKGNLLNFSPVNKCVVHICNKQINIQCIWLYTIHVFLLCWDLTLLFSHVLTFVFHASVLLLTKLKITLACCCFA